MKNKITLKELAKLLNVSISTVSKALNDSPEISTKTVERVKELAKLHNYRPNPVAVNLKSSKSGTIGVIIPNISNTFFAKVLSGIEAEAQRAGFQVITYISNEKYEREKQICDMLTTGYVDGVLIAVAEETQRKKEFDHLYQLVDYGIPVVLYDRINFDIPADRIGIDDVGTFGEITKRLLDKGLKKVGIATTIHHMGVGKLRIDGYKQALPKEKNFFIANSARPAVLKEKTEKMLVEDKVEAVICTDFESTMQVYRTAFEHKINIPKDLKVIGFIGKELARFLAPSISYIDQFPEQMGAGAMELLEARLNNYNKEKSNVERIIKTSLVDLESTQF
ncbi:LacI family DNA-binding transcriptional regulator [Salegentibacter sp. F14]